MQGFCYHGTAVAIWLLLACMAVFPQAHGHTFSGLGIDASFETRLRAESLVGQFRKDTEGSDQLLLIRSLASLRKQRNSYAFNVELQDSRGYYGDAGTPLSSSFVNPLDVLQSYVIRTDLPGLLGNESASELKLGRQTVSIGSKRQIERVNFANVVKSYTGAHFRSYTPRGDELHVLRVSPIKRKPGSSQGLLDNDLAADEEQWRRRIWALHYRRADAFPRVAANFWGELFIYGLAEDDTTTYATLGRSLRTVGFRLYRKPAVGEWDLDLESAWRWGQRRLGRADVAQPNAPLDVNAWMTVLMLGHTFAIANQPRLALEYYFASGDEDPLDKTYGQYERLFGARRTDLNNTSIYGPLTPANLSAPALRLDMRFGEQADLRIKYTKASLASASDSWVIAKLRDPTGRSGSFIGHAIDTRWRFRPALGGLDFEAGISALLFGNFARNVPAGPVGKRSVFSYMQVSYRH